MPLTKELLSQVVKVTISLLLFEGTLLIVADNCIGDDVGLTRLVHRELISLWVDRNDSKLTDIGRKVIHIDLFLFLDGRSKSGLFFHDVRLLGLLLYYEWLLDLFLNQFLLRFCFFILFNSLLGLRC